MSEILWVLPCVAFAIGYGAAALFDWLAGKWKRDQK